MLHTLSKAERAPECPVTVRQLQGDASGVDHLLAKAAQKLITLSEENSLLVQLPRATHDLEEITKCAARIRGQSAKLVLVGIGGSSLGAQALTSIAPADHRMQFHVLDNPDPDSMSRVLGGSDPQRTSWLFVSKSGGTLETLSQVMIILHRLEERIGAEGIAQRCLVITEEKDSPLKRLAEHYGIPALKHENLGGRWAGFSNIGLLPAACCGIDISECRRGADAMLQHALSSDIIDNQPLQGASFIATQHEASRRVHVVMPYGDGLDFSPWYRQLVSESLGKSGKGITPLCARGAIDQHSMLQMMMEGTDDKFFTVITSAYAGKGEKIPAALARLCGLDYLKEQPIGNILAAFQEGTVASLQGSGRPIRTIHLPEINAYYLGALLMYFMLETLYVSELLGVNPFDQPGVEDSKVRAGLILRG